MIVFLRCNDKDVVLTLMSLTRQDRTWLNVARLSDWMLVGLLWLNFVSCSVVLRRRRRWYKFIKLSLPAAKVSTHPELLAAVAALLTRQQVDDVPILCNVCTIQQVTHVVFRMLGHFGCDYGLG